MRTFEADVQYGEDWISVDGKKLKLLSTRDPGRPLQENVCSGFLELFFTFFISTPTDIGTQS